LKPGATYVWEVTATLADGAAGEATYGAFTVATEERAARANELRALAAGSDVPYLTLAAAWFEENNFLPEAVAAYERLVALRPATAPYYFALSRLYQQEDRPQDAATAYAKGRQLQPLPLKPPRPEWPPKE
jgi:tetratricopeptide (TPR) repeat protein